jgi:hypothetical protein
MLSWLASVATIASLAGVQHVPADTSIRDSVRVGQLVTASSDTAEAVDSSIVPPTLFEHQDFFAHSGDSIVTDTTLPTRRPRAIEYSEAYHTRLKIHQIGAYLMIPLFISEYVLGEKLLTSTNRSGGLKTAHSAVAAGVGVVFVANTVTGAWNFWDARKDPNGRARREVHSALMVASDVGFLLTAASAGNAKRSLSRARTHRTIAISSIALSAIGSGMMWLWKN